MTSISSLQKLSQPTTEAEAFHNFRKSSPGQTNQHRLHTNEKFTDPELVVLPNWSGPCELRTGKVQSFQVRHGISSLKENVKKESTKKSREHQPQPQQLEVIGDQAERHHKVRGSDVVCHSSQDDSDEAVQVVALLKACAKQKDLQGGRKLHVFVSQRGLLEQNVFVGNALISMYAKCGALERAQEVLDQLAIRNAVSWNAIIAGYAQHGHSKEALYCFEKMQSEGFIPTPITAVCILKACGACGASKKGKYVHAMIVREGWLPDKDVIVANALVDMYGKCGILQKAYEVFEEIRVRDRISWNALIAGHVQHEHDEEALDYFDQMRSEGFSPDVVTFLCILKACGGVGEFHKGQQVHVEIVRDWLLDKDLAMGTALVDMYANCGMLDDAQDVFDELPARDVITWTALITGYALHEHGEKAVTCFRSMELGGCFPNAFTFAGVLKACSCAGASEKGQDIHARVVKEALLETDYVVGNAVVDMYAKCGMLRKAREIFDEIRFRDVVSWNTLIGGYAQHECGEEALDCFEWMQVEGFDPDLVTFVCVFKACGSLGLAHKGQELHDEIIRNGLFEHDRVVCTALVDMYANCGMLAEAQEVFDSLLIQDRITWNALLVGYAQLGEDEAVFCSFNKMLAERKEPSFVTFTIILNTCSHGGLLDKGQMCFEMYGRSYGIPTLEHHTCMVDLFGRAGHLDNAIAMMDQMPTSLSCTIWHTFLSACQKWESTKLGRWAFQQAMQLDKNDGAAFVCMNNIYSL